MNIHQLENELWEAADQLRANSKFTAAEYAMPVLAVAQLQESRLRFSKILVIQFLCCALARKDVLQMLRGAAKPTPGTGAA